MKKIIFLGLFFSISATFFGQQIPFEILKSAVFQDDVGKSTIVLAEKTNENNLLIVRSYNNNGLSLEEGFYIEKYDAKLNLLKNFKFKMSHPPSQKYKMVAGITAFENNIVVVEVFYDSNEKAYICQANTIDANDVVSKKELFRLSKEEVKANGEIALEHDSYVQSKKLFSYDNSGSINSEVDKHNLDFISFDQKHPLFEEQDAINIAMVTNESDSAFGIIIDFYGEKSENSKLYLFDSHLNKKIDTEFKRDIKDDDYLFQNFQVSPEGDAIYLLAKSYSKDLKQKEKGGKYQFELTKITNTFQKSLFIDPQEHYINSLKIIFQKKQLICIGFYSDLKETKFQGISYFSFNPDSLDILNTKYNPFTEQFMTDKYGDKKNNGLKCLTFKKVFFTQNNDLIFNAEEQYISSSYGNSYGMGSGPYYSYDDIVTAKLNATGDLIWARNINKNQSASNEENMIYLSYTSMLKDDSCYFFINTSDEIKKLRNDRIEFGDVRKNKSNLNVIRVNANGDFDYKKILDDEQNAVPFMVAKGITLDNTVYFLGRRGKTKQLLKVTL